MMRSARILLPLLILIPASAQDHTYRIFETFNGRFHCNGQWNDFQFKMSPATGLLGMVDEDAGVTATLQFYFRRSITSLDGATYVLGGPYDAKTGRFHLEPKRWATPHPAVFEMIGIEGVFDRDTRKMTAKMLSDKCDAVEMVPPGVTLPPLQAQQSPQQAAANGPNNARPERRISPSNVTNYLDPAAYSPDFEYWVTAWSDPPGAVHEAEPIDEENDQLKKDKWACVGSNRVTWDASGLKGTAPDAVGITERYVVECVGNCKGVTYRPYVGANVTHFGLSAPLPTMQIKSVFFGGTSFRWNFSRPANTQPPPEIHVHRWKPLTGFGPFDRGPAEVARAIASAPPCKAPRTR